MICGSGKVEGILSFLWDKAREVCLSGSTVYFIPLNLYFILAFLSTQCWLYDGRSDILTLLRLQH